MLVLIYAKSKNIEHHASCCLKHKSCLVCMMIYEIKKFPCKCCLNKTNHLKTSLRIKKKRDPFLKADDSSGGRRHGGPHVSVRWNEKAFWNENLLLLNSANFLCPFFSHQDRRLLARPWWEKIKAELPQLAFNKHQLLIPTLKTIVSTCTLNMSAAAGLHSASVIFFKC